MTILSARKRKIIDGYDREFRAGVAEAIAVAIEASAPVPGAGCDERWCHCHARHTAWLEAAGVARQIGGVG